MTMLAQSLAIESRHRRFTPLLASLEDFSCTSGPDVRAESVLTNPALSLYCLDDPAQRALFVEVLPAVDLTTAPFVYQMQYDHAQRLIAVPYVTLRALAHELPAIEHLIVIDSTGRCGSTLVSHLLNAVEGVVSLSEPDAATQFVELRHHYAQEDARVRDLLDCTLRFLFKPSTVGPRAVCALKHRSYGVQVMDLFHTAYPQTRHLYLYRDAVGFVASFSRIVRRLGMAEYTPVDEALALLAQTHQDLAYLPAYLDAGTTALSIAQIFTLIWLANIDAYLAQYTRGITALAVRYDDLDTHREQVVNAILTYCGLALTHAPDLPQVFSRDAQAGTELARDNPAEGNTVRLNDQQMEEITRILRRHPVVKTADFVVPGTLAV